MVQSCSSKVVIRFELNIWCLSWPTPPQLAVTVPLKGSLNMFVGLQFRWDTSNNKQPHKQLEALCFNPDQEGRGRSETGLCRFHTVTACFWLTGLIWLKVWQNVGALRDICRMNPSWKSLWGVVVWQARLKTATNPIKCLNCRNYYNIYC